MRCLEEDQDHVRAARRGSRSQLLPGRRNVVILGTIATFTARRATIRVWCCEQTGVIGHLNSCSGDSCLIEMGQSGSIQRDAIWGVLDDEMRE